MEMAVKLRLGKRLKPLLFIGLFISHSNASAYNLFYEYGALFGVPPSLLWAIAKVESNFNPSAVAKNTNGTKDIGLMQINTIHMERLKKDYGISENHLFDVHINVAVGAQILSRCLRKHGYTEKGINCYNGRTTNNQYAKKVLMALNEIKSTGKH